jgi:hypothetical protein
MHVIVLRHWGWAVVSVVLVVSVEEVSVEDVNVGVVVVVVSVVDVVVNGPHSIWAASLRVEEGQSDETLAIEDAGTKHDRRPMQCANAASTSTAQALALNA